MIPKPQPPWRALTSVEMRHIIGADSGGAPHWAGVTGIFRGGCGSCGGVGGTPSGSSSTDGGNFYMANGYLRYGGVKLPVGISLHYNSQSAFNMNFGVAGWKTNFNMLVIEMGYYTIVTDEDGTEINFTGTRVTS